MANLPIQRASKAGTNVALVAASAGGDRIPAAPNNALRVKNGGASGITVTANAQRPCNQGVLHDAQVTVPAGEERTIGGLEVSQFRTDDGYFDFDYSAVGSVTVAGVKS